MSRQTQYKVMMKLATAISKFDSHLNKMKECLESPELPVSSWREGDLIDVRQGLESIKDFRESVLYFRRCLQEDFPVLKPTRFTGEELKEMRYLFSVGVSKNKLTKRYQTTFGVLNKYLAIS